jgi:hypothetical protein
MGVFEQRDMSQTGIESTNTEPHFENAELCEIRGGDRSPQELSRLLEDNAEAIKHVTSGILDVMSRLPAELRAGILDGCTPEMCQNTSKYPLYSLLHHQFAS